MDPICGRTKWCLDLKDKKQRNPSVVRVQLFGIWGEDLKDYVSKRKDTKVSYNGGTP